MQAKWTGGDGWGRQGACANQKAGALTPQHADARRAGIARLPGEDGAEAHKEERVHARTWRR